MRKYILVIAVVSCITLYFLLSSILKRRRRKKIDQEQITQRVREEALDHALSNRLHKTDPGPRQPVVIQYGNGHDRLPKGTRALHLTEKCYKSTVTRQYVFGLDNRIYISSQDGRGAVFGQRVGGKPVFCEFFCVDDELYVRGAGQNAVLVRGKKTAMLTPAGICLNSNDIIETPCGRYLTQIIQN